MDICLELDIWQEVCSSIDRENKGFVLCVEDSH